MNPFHLAIPVKDLKVMRAFYKDILGCTEGRNSEHWVDFNLFGHQLVIHQKSDFKVPKPLSNPVDGHDVPIPHFGVVLDWDVWTQLADDLKEKQVEFVIDPYIRFEGQVGEQATLFFLDPENNALEFKAFKNIDQLFEK
ncbi:VOC family protein [Crocinitomicaceae bacterium]|nr:VOC family protein [Crocinitomicaceae bacterium]